MLSTGKILCSIQASPLPEDTYTVMSPAGTLTAQLEGVTSLSYDELTV